MLLPSFHLSLPPWVPGWLSGQGEVFEKQEDRMQLAVELARQNMRHGTGGPFGAAIFEIQTHRLFAVGINLVVHARCSAAHAEITAIMLAQQAMGTHDLAAMRPCELVTSTEPCAMCMGAIPWSGIRQVVCGARDEDARKIGFDEGIKPPGWAAAFESRNIRVIRDVLRLQAAEVLNEYAATGGKIY